MITREHIVDVLENIALLLELKGENPFKTRAYRTGAEIVRGFPGDIVGLAAADDLKGIKGLGDALTRKLHELATTGALAYYDTLRADFPESLFELFDVQGLGAKKIKVLHDTLGVGSLADLRRVCVSGEAAELPGFGEKSVAKILEALAYREEHAAFFRLCDVTAPAERILDILRAHPAASQVTAAGSYLRGKEIVHDLDFLVATRDSQALMDFFVAQPFVESVLAHGATKSSVRLAGGLQCDLRAVANDAYPFALNYFTGSKEHNVALRSRALKLGYSLNEYRLAPVDAEKTPEPGPIPDERALYRALGLDYVEPALRENTGEIEAAEEGRLPDLVRLENLRGTFHNHTVASDGTNTLAEMAGAARELGLQYLGIADHSKSSFQANGLDAGRLLAQVAEIRALNEAYAADGDGFRLLAGTECDILRDGTLDFPDEILDQLDYVVASVHNAFNLTETAMTERIVRAIGNPRVTMLGHLTGRLLLKREPYALDIPAVIDAAAAAGTLIELNAHPWRLDMDWRWWKLAKEKGVRCAINPDAHATSDLQYLHYGILIARKGWLTRRDVVNTLDLDALRPYLPRLQCP